MVADWHLVASFFSQECVLGLCHVLGPPRNLCKCCAVSTVQRCLRPAHSCQTARRFSVLLVIMRKGADMKSSSVHNLSGAFFLENNFS